MTLLVLSPHLDDAVLSVGAALHGRADVVVVTVCSITGDPARVDEDLRALESLGVRAIHLGMLDAPLRGIAATWEGLCNGDDDDAFADLVADRFDTFVNTEVRPAEVWGPLGCGAHVDHRAVHRAVARVWPAACFYEDRPYARRRGALATAWERLGATILQTEADDVDDDLHFDRVIGAPPIAPTTTTTPTEIGLGGRRFRRQLLPIDGPARVARLRAIDLYESQRSALVGPADQGGWPFDDVAEALWRPL
ncbi:MAG: PIG-L family deacetylase [Deltaproteobacteria bacterium]|nr:PIG-L family deacetylase [Deltaproteobacteria bacterium]